MIETENNVDEIVDFAIKYYVYDKEDREEMEYLIQQHIKYKTIIVVKDKPDGKILSICRFNILPNGYDVIIMDAIIHPKHRRKNLLLRMMLKGLQMYPDIKYLIFERHVKGKPFKKIPIKWLLKRRF